MIILNHLPTIVDSNRVRLQCRSNCGVFWRQLSKLKDLLLDAALYSIFRRRIRTIEMGSGDDQYCWRVGLESYTNRKFG